jgi:hypothetical protein
MLGDKRGRCFLCELTNRYSRLAAHDTIGPKIDHRLPERRRRVWQALKTGFSVKL